MRGIATAEADCWKTFSSTGLVTPAIQSAWTDQLVNCWSRPRAVLQDGWLDT